MDCEQVTPALANACLLDGFIDEATKLVDAGLEWPRDVLKISKMGAGVTLQIAKDLVDETLGLTLSALPLFLDMAKFLFSGALDVPAVLKVLFGGAALFLNRTTAAGQVVDEVSAG